MSVAFPAAYGCCFCEFDDVALMGPSTLSHMHMGPLGMTSWKGEEN